MIDSVGVAAAAGPAGFGDWAGEHRRISRGQYSAWVHVWVAFLLETLLLALTLGLLAAAGVGLLIDELTSSRGILHAGMLVTTIVVSVSAACVVFHDRWRCIEALTSRYCSGWINLSLTYAPFIALVYANVRGIRKLRPPERHRRVRLPSARTRRR